MMKEPYVVRRKILFGDCDPGGIVYTPRITHFIVEAGLEMLADRLGGPAERKLFELGIGPPARAMSIEYLRPMVWDEELEVHAQITAIGEHSLTSKYEGRVGGALAFKAELTQVFVGMKSLKTVPIPDPIRAALTRD
jgi:4-hydroxybenzoyl-CoA thioesterase